MVNCRITLVRTQDPTITGEAVLLGGQYINEGEDGPTYMRIIDADTGQYTNLGVSNITPTGVTESMAAYTTMPDKPYNLILEVGEGDQTNPLTITDSKILTIVNPAYPPPSELKPLIPILLVAVLVLFFLSKK